MAHHYEHFWLDPKFWVAVSFVIFFLLLGKKVWGALAGALDGKAEGIRRQLSEAAELRAQAEQMLTDNGLVPKAAQQPSDAVANGNVISQDPTAGASAKKDSTVTIAVSSGADLVQIPDVVGMDVNDAVDRVQKAGLVPGFAQGASSVPANHVYRTDPDHVPVPKGSKVILYVSKGPSGTNDACKGIHPPKWCLVRITDILVPTLMPSFTVPVGPGH